MKERIIPFAMRFQEKIPEGEVFEVRGKYNEVTQTWEWPKRPDSSDIKATFQERPPTVCTVVTRINPTVVQTDRGVDD